MGLYTKDAQLRKKKDKVAHQEQLDKAELVMSQVSGSGLGKTLQDDAKAEVDLAKTALGKLSKQSKKPGIPSASFQVQG